MTPRERVVIAFLLVFYLILVVAGIALFLDYSV